MKLVTSINLTTKLCAMYTGTKL